MISDAIDFVAEESMISSGLPIVMGSQADDIECFGLMIGRKRVEIAGRSGIDALHIISHSAASSAKPGALTLTGKVLPGTMPTCRPSGQA